MGLGEWIAEHLLEGSAKWLAERGSEKVVEQGAEKTLETAGKQTLETAGKRTIEATTEKAGQSAFVRLEEGTVANGEKAIYGVTESGEKKLLQGAELKAAQDALAKQAEDALARTTAEAGQQLVQDTASESAKLAASGGKQALETETRQLVQGAGDQLTDKQFTQLLEQSGASDAEKGFLSKAFSSATTKGPLQIYLGKGDLAAKLSALERVAAKGDSATGKACQQYADLLLGKAGLSAKGIDAGEMAAIDAVVSKNSAFGQKILENARKIATERGVEIRGPGVLAQRLANMGSYAKAHPVMASFQAAATGASIAVNTVKYGAKTAWWMATHKTATALIVGAGIAADEYIDDGRIVHAVGDHIVKPAAKSVGEKAVELGDKGLQAMGLPPVLQSLFNSGGSGSGTGSANTGDGNSTDNDNGGEHWWDSLKKFASSLTGPWAILGMFLNVIAWIGQAIGGFASSLTGTGTKVQTNNPSRVAAVQNQAGAGQTMRATTYDHDGDQTSSLLDKPVPDLTPAPAGP
ncbi:MAG TPA: hypothetical protein VHB99_02995 [Pirellulales bacterium]|nr:hypothetical protein [Pirellulales bacterium]